LCYDMTKEGRKKAEELNYAPFKTWEGIEVIGNKREVSDSDSRKLDYKYNMEKVKERRENIEKILEQAGVPLSGNTIRKKMEEEYGIGITAVSTDIQAMKVSGRIKAVEIRIEDDAKRTFYALADYDAPKITAGRNMILETMMFRREKARERRNALEWLLHKKMAPLSMSSIKNMLKSHDTADRLIRDDVAMLCKEKIIKRVGRGKDTKYAINRCRGK